MIRFRCQQCGHRIAVSRRHLGRLAVCPDCGATTHPVARHVSKSEPRATAAPDPSRPHACANCGKPIGKLQQLHVWQNQIVCTPCHRTLSADGNTTALAAPAATAVTVTRRPAEIVDPQTSWDPESLRHMARPFGGGLFGAIVGLCVTGAAMYGALSLLKDAAGLVTGLAFGALGLVGVCFVLKAIISAGRVAPGQMPRAAPLLRERRHQSPHQVR